MMAEGMPQSSHHSSAFARLLEWLARMTLRAPIVVILGAVVVSGLAIYASMNWLGFKTSRLDLLNPKSGYNQRWLAFLNEFGDKDDAIVVVEGPGRKEVVAAIESLAVEINRPNRPFEALIHQRDLSRVKAKGLHFLTESELQQVQGFIDKMQPILRGDWSQLNAGRFLRELNQQIMAAGKNRTAATPSNPAEDKASQAMLESAISRFSTSLTAALQDNPEFRSPWPEMGQLSEKFADFDPEYILVKQDQMGMLLLRFKDEEQKLISGGEAIGELRKIISQVSRSHPQAKISLTGMPVLEYDEMTSSQSDMTVASIVSIAGVVGLLLAGFGSMRYAILSVITLILGMCWSFGFVTCSIGHLNLLSVSFAAILIGLGIDFSIHYLARYLQLRHEGESCDDALVHTASQIGPGIVTGAVTTAFAFFTTGLTDFTGVAELGLIAGAGILICLAASFWILPPMIALWDRSRTTQAIATTLPIDGILQPIAKFPMLVMLAVVGFSIAVTPGVFRLRYDHNLLNLQPRHLESVEIEKRLITESDRSVWFAVSMARNREELKARQAIFEKLPSVERTEEITSLVPESNAAKQSIIQNIQSRLSGLPAAPPLIPAASAKEIDAELAQLEMILSMMGAPGKKMLAQISPLRKQLRRVTEDVFSQRLSNYQQRSASDLLANFQVLYSLADPGMPSWDDVPEGLVKRFVGKNGVHLLRVYARGDIWDMDLLSRFVTDVERVDPNVTGHPIQTFYASHQMQKSYVHAAIYSLIALLIVLMIDFKSISHSLLALAPLALGIWQMFGVMGLLDIPFNAANMIVLPLILGIGIDNGVHVVHDWRSQPGRRFQFSNSIAVSMVLCSSTTMVGFCSMIFAKHQGLRSLGQVLTLSVFLCLATSLMFLPALLSWMTRNDEEVDPESTVAAKATRRRQAAAESQAAIEAAVEIDPAVTENTTPEPHFESSRRRSRRAARIRAS